MHRITISLPEALAALVADEADRQGTSVSDLVRRTLLEAFAGESELPFVALGRSGRRTTARDAEAILAREWTGARRR